MKTRNRRIAVLLSLLTFLAAASFAQAQVTPVDSIVLTNSAGLKWSLQKFDGGWALGQIFLNGKAVEKQASRGMLILRRRDNGKQIWVKASNAVESEGEVTLTGSTSKIGTEFTFTMKIKLAENIPAATITTDWDVNSDASNWMVCFTYHDGFDNDWRMNMSTSAGNSSKVSKSKIEWVGLPGPLMYRTDLSMAALFVTDYTFDYFHHSKWSGSTGMYFEDGSMPPQFRLSTSRGLRANDPNNYPLQIVFSDAGNYGGMMKQLVEGWIALNNWKVTPHKYIRSTQKAMDMFIEGHRNTNLWNSSIGAYEAQVGSSHIPLKDVGIAALFDYRLYKKTGDKMWRDRSFRQIQFILNAQIKDKNSSKYGMIRGQYLPSKGGYDDGNRKRKGLFPDLTAMVVQYLLLTYKAVKDHENLDQTEWLNAGKLAADWVIRQQNSDGGLPATLNLDGSKHKASNPGRSLVAFPVIYRITGEQKYLDFAKSIGDWAKKNVEDKLWFTGFHPDRNYDHLETHGVWTNVEHTLDLYEETGDPSYLARAEGNAYLNFTWRCPKQLPWVDNPTESANDEQQSWNLYTVYCYNNRMMVQLYRLYNITRNELWRTLYNRLLQLQHWSTIATGSNMGNMQTGISNPWKAGGNGYNWQEDGKSYHTHYALDLYNQLLDMGMPDTLEPLIAVPTDHPGKSE